jgi:hypothetical protein
LNLAQQLGALQCLYRQGKGRLLKNRLTWEAALRPSAFSREYIVHIDYRPGCFPTTRVLRPSLRVLSGGRKPPHVFADPDDPLCLFYGAAHEWGPSMPIARTIVPWACEWLFHFEAWLFTGVWEGGGISHEPGNQAEERLSSASAL